MSSVFRSHLYTVPSGLTLLTLSSKLLNSRSLYERVNVRNVRIISVQWQLMSLINYGTMNVRKTYPYPYPSGLSNPVGPVNVHADAKATFLSWVSKFFPSTVSAILFTESKIRYQILSVLKSTCGYKRFNSLSSMSQMVAGIYFNRNKFTLTFLPLVSEHSEFIKQC